MGKLKVLKTSPLATVQDFGRFGYRRYGIPHCGAMDRVSMIHANTLVGNSEASAVLEYELAGMSFEVLDEIQVSLVGADMLVDDQLFGPKARVKKGSVLHLSKPKQNYAYLAIAGSLRAKIDFESYATDTKAGFGGIEGRTLKKGDVLHVDGSSPTDPQESPFVRAHEDITSIRIMKGPEWGTLKELPSTRTYQIDSSSDRMGIRLAGDPLEAEYQEISSSAVVPGTIQLPPNGIPIILMNDCQTTGGYPRIGKVLDSELGKLAQIKPGKSLRLLL